MSGRRILRVVMAAGLVVASCSSDDESAGGATSEEYDVATDVVSHETTQDIWVYAPDADGSWPIVYAMHGLDGTGDALAITATELARNGYVVFSPTWRTEMDAECGYRYALSIADQYGGDPDLGIAYVGHSLGAQIILIGGLDDAAYAEGGTFDECFTAPPRPSVLVPIAGCYYEFEGEEYPFEPAPHSGRDLDITMVVGTDDAVCEPWQSENATDALVDVGHSVRLVEVDGGDHANTIFYKSVDEWVPVPDDPVGKEVVDIIVAAIEANR